jgi:hypothetical protein
MSGIVCLSVLAVLYVGFGWAGVLCGAIGMAVGMVLIAWRALDREDAELVRRAQR